tara:strand:+ start:1693 stop:2457 length:765 start_codon:yes stop_codon:yes gene_type:complete
MLFGGYESDERKSSVQFGLNQGVKLQKFEYNPSIEFPNGNTAEGVEMEFNVNGSVIRTSILPPNKVYDKGQEITDPTHKAFKKAIVELKKRVYHIAECFMTRETLQEVVAIPKSFGDFMKDIIDNFENGWQEKELDLFLQYQWQLRAGAERKYLEVPKKTSQGAFLVPACSGAFEKVIVQDGNAMSSGAKIGEFENKSFTTDNGLEITFKERNVALFYLNENNEPHPFARSEWFMENGWAQADDEAEEELSSWA